MNNLIQGFTDGHYSLPDEVVTAHRTTERLAEFAAEHLSGFGRESTARSEVLAATIEAARSGKAMPDVDVMAVSRREDERVRDVRSILDEARERARRDLIRSVRDQEPEIVTGHLRPALAEVIERASKIAPGMKGISVAALGDGHAPVRKAWGELVDLSARYASIRAARADLRTLVPTEDTLDIFGEFKNTIVLWPEVVRQKSRAGAVLLTDRVQVVTPPWPEVYPDRLVWIVTAAAEPWLPLPGEQDTHYVADIKRRNDEIAEAVAARREAMA